MSKIQRLHKVILAVSVLLLAACNNGPKPEAIAEEFLNAYLSTDYEKAASFCTPDLSQDLMKALEQAEALNEEIKAKIKKHTHNYKPQIDSLSHNKGKDTVKIYYSIINSTNSGIANTTAENPATAAPEASNATASNQAVSATQIISSTLTVVKAEEGWKVNTLNN